MPLTKAVVVGFGSEDGLAAALAGGTMKIDAFASTVPHL
jgi:hypothetical protein